MFGTGLGLINGSKRLGRHANGVPFWWSVRLSSTFHLAYVQIRAQVHHGSASPTIKLKAHSRHPVVIIGRGNYSSQ